MSNRPHADRQISVLGSQFKIEFFYNPDIVDAVKGLPDRRFKSIPSNDGRGGEKFWLVPLKYGELVRLFAEEHGFEIDTMAQMSIDARKQQTIDPPKLSDDWLDKDIQVTRGTRQLFWHQRQGVVFLARNMRAILADDMGLGKTTQALVAAQLFHLPVVVVCPASLQDNWRREAKIVDVPIPMIYTWAKFPATLATAYPKGFVVIFDEAHYAQAGHRSQRGERFLTLCDEASAAFLLTGTPMKNGLPINLEPLLIAIQHPIVLDRRGYELHYCAAHATNYSRWDVTGAAHLDELHVKVKDKMLRRTKAQCLDLPPFTRQMRQAEVNPQAEDRYNGKFLELRKRYIDRLSQGIIFDGAEALVMLTHLRQASSAAKVLTTVEMAEEIAGQGGQVVIFGAFDEPLRDIWTKLDEKQGISCTYMQSADIQRVRTQKIDDFQAGKYRVFLSTFGTGGVGVNLHAAQTVILHDRPWTPADCEQAESRLHRYGQKDAVTSYWVQYGTIDDEIDELLQEKAERIEKVMVGERKTMRGIKTIQDVAAQILPDIFKDM